MLTKRDFLTFFRNLQIVLLVTLVVGCAGNAPTPETIETSTSAPETIPTITPIPSLTSTPASVIPMLDHVVWVVLENEEFSSVIGNSEMPVFNKFATDYTLLTQFYAVRHPSLPNYIAMISGDTFGIDSNCKDCFLNSTSLPDLIEASGRTWKTYQEGMPEPCFVGSTEDYAQKHNPFVYFDPIRLNTARCQQSVVPLTALQTDIVNGTLPNFMFIMPNICNSAHDCSLNTADQWLDNLMKQLIPSLAEDSSRYLIVLTWDEGNDNLSCCGLPADAGGQIAVVLISPLVKQNFEDSTPYTHYSLLKTISNSWALPYLGHAGDDNQVLITEPWK